MKVESVVKVEHIKASQELILVRLLSGRIPVLRKGEVLQGKVVQLSAEKAVIRLPSGHITVETRPGIRPGEQVWLKEASQQQKPTQLELLKQPPKLMQPPVIFPGKQAPLQHIKSGQPQSRITLNQDSPAWKGMIKRIITGGEKIQPGMIYHGKVETATTGKTLIRLEQGGMLKLDGAPGLMPGQKVLLRSTEKSGSTSAFIEITAAKENKITTPLPLIKQGKLLVANMLQKPDKSPKSAQKITLPSTGTGYLPAPGVDISSGAGNKQTSTQPVLKKGQQLMAHVLQKLPAGKAIIEMQGQQMELKTPPGILTGDHILLRVNRVQPQTEFAILDTKPDMKTKVVHQLRNLLANRTPTGTNMANLQQALNTVVNSGLATPESKLYSDFKMLSDWLKPVLDGSKPPDPDRVRRMILDGGQHYESRLAASTSGDQPNAMPRLAEHDLKALLLRLLSHIRQVPAGAEIERLTSTLNRTLTGIESAQASSLLSQLHGDGLRFEVPFVLGQQLATVHISIKSEQHPSENTYEKQGFGVLFLLDLEKTGQIRVDAYIQAKTLQSTIYLEQSAATNFFRTSIVSLQSRMEGLGFDTVSMNVKMLSEISPEKNRDFESLTTGIPQNVNLLDTRA